LAQRTDQIIAIDRMLVFISLVVSEPLSFESQSFTSKTTNLTLLSGAQIFCYL